MAQSDVQPSCSSVPGRTVTISHKASEQHSPVVHSVKACAAYASDEADEAWLVIHQLQVYGGQSVAASNKMSARRQAAVRLDVIRMVTA